MAKTTKLNTPNAEKYLLLTNKGKLKWRGEFKYLQAFFEKNLNIKGSVIFHAYASAHN